MYQPAPAYWRKSPQHILLWATMSVLAKVKRRSGERRVARWGERLGRTFASLLDEKKLASWWRNAQEKLEAIRPELAKQESDDLVMILAEDYADDAVFELTAVWDATALELRRDLLEAVLADLKPHVFPQELKDAALARSFEKVRGVPNTVKEEMRRLLAQTLKEHKTYEEFARALRRRWIEISASRAMRITRTEYAMVAGQATLDLYKLQGTPMKVWITVGDPGVCEICQNNADAGPIPIDGEFPEGDETVPAHPNCRCNIAGAL